ncbi:MAG: ABC transporter substrate-binding protein [Candidatus Aminicenantales bacterium]
MNKKKAASYFALFFVLAAFFTLKAQEKKIKDSLGTLLSLSAPPRRIVSLAPNITEILFALGLEQSIVGVTTYCDYPSQALTKERIGGLVDPNLEKIKSLEPDLVIGFRGNPIELLERLKSLEVPVIALDMEQNIEAVFSLIEKVGDITHRCEEARKITESMKKKYVFIQRALRKIEQRPKVFLSLHATGLWTCGRESFLNNLITRAGGENIARTIPRKWLNLNREKLIDESPEIIIILARSEKQFSQAKEWLSSLPGIREVKAVKEGRIFFVDQNIATRPGPRLIDALQQMAEIIHPECFSSKR